MPRLKECDFAVGNLWGYSGRYKAQDRRDLASMVVESSASAYRLLPRDLIEVITRGTIRSRGAGAVQLNLESILSILEGWTRDSGVSARSWYPVQIAEFSEFFGEGKVWNWNAARAILSSVWGVPVEPATTLESWQEQVRSLADLQEGWDSYDAKPPSGIAIDAALQILGKLGSLSIEPDWIVPTSEDSILLQFQHGGSTFKWELESDGDIGVMIRSAEGEAEYFDLRVDGIDAFFEDHCYGGF